MKDFEREPRSSLDRESMTRRLFIPLLRYDMYWDLFAFLFLYVAQAMGRKGGRRKTYPCRVRLFIPRFGTLFWLNEVFWGLP